MLPHNAFSDIPHADKTHDYQSGLQTEKQNVLSGGTQQSGKIIIFLRRAEVLSCETHRYLALELKNK